MKNNIALVAIIVGVGLNVSVFTGCDFVSKSPDQLRADSIAETFPTVHAIAQTDPVLIADDAADDPCVWINPTNAQQSLIIGTNKKEGIEVYDLEGKLLHTYSVGRLNNVDVRYNVKMGDTHVDLVAASNRTYNSISLFSVTGKQELVNWSNDKLVSKLDEVYGFALGKPKGKSEVYAFVVSKEGVLEQWILDGTTGDFTGKVVRNHDFGSICEGIVADDYSGYVYVGQEEQGVWKLPMDPSTSEKPELIVKLTDHEELIDDLEGLTIYYSSETEGYLIASIQGNNSYAVFNRETPHSYLGSFRITKSENFDGALETDGLDVENRALPGYPNGFLIVQDGHNHKNGKKVNQNFKLVDWKEIANAFEPTLQVKPEFIK